MSKADKKSKSTAADEEVQEDWDANRNTIEALCRQSPNDTCADCGTAGTRWVSVNHGVFVCIRCSGVHRSIGSHVTKVKSTNLDKWTSSEISVMRQIGNARGKELFESRLPRGQKPLTGNEPDAVLKAFIVQKYEMKAFSDPEWPSTLKRVYKIADYKSGLKALKAMPSPTTTSPKPAADFYSEEPAPKEKKSKKDKSSKKDKAAFGAFGLITVPADEHDARRALMFAHFGVETETAVEADATPAE